MFSQRSGEDFLLLGHDALSRGSGIPTFRRNVLPSSLNVNKTMLIFKDERSISVFHRAFFNSIID